MYFGQDQDFKVPTELSEKVQYSRKQTTKSLNEAILLISINEALLWRKNFVSFR